LTKNGDASKNSADFAKTFYIFEATYQGLLPCQSSGL